MFLFDVLKKCKKELIFKIITSIIIQGLLLIIPVYWSNTINHVTNGIYDKAINLTIITLTLTLLYYFWSYANQKTWYTFYNKLYLEYTNNIIKYSPSDVSIGQYTNIINNDIDIIGTFLGNLVTRIIQIIEFLVIYFYFLSIDKYIFFATLITSIIMIVLIFYFGNKIEVVNKTRKGSSRQPRSFRRIFSSMHVPRPRFPDSLSFHSNRVSRCRRHRCDQSLPRIPTCRYIACRR